MVHATFSLVFNISFELRLLGLANFLGDFFVLDLFGDFIPKGENVGPNQASVSKVGRGKLEHRKRRSKGGKFDLGGVWMMLSIQASVSGSNFVIFLQIYACFACVVINHQKGGDCSEHVPICHLFKLILVIRANTSNGTNHIV
jgi:hypothetical protein